MKHNTRFNGTIAIPLSLLALSSLALGCGGYTTGSRTTSSSGANYISSYNGANSGNPTATNPTGGSSPANPTPTPTPTGTATPGIPPYQFKIEGVGYNSYHVKVQAGKLLKVKFRPGVNSKVVADTSYTPKYAHLGVYITVGEHKESTEMLSNGLMDGRVQTSTIIDYSSDFTNVTNASDRVTVDIIISQPNNDFYCINGYYQYCPWTQVYETHPWNGTLFVQTDDTDPI